jgi:hypothetical protein
MPKDMQRRALLGTVAGSISLFAGCGGSEPPQVTLESGFGATRPIDEPVIRHGLTADAEQYEWVRLLHADDTVPTTDTPQGRQLSRAVDDIGDGQFGLLTNLRAAGDAPAFYWPDRTEIVDGRLRIELVRESLDTTVDAAEAVGYAFARFRVLNGPVPEGGTVTFPSGATTTVGRTEDDGWW